MGTLEAAVGMGLRTCLEDFREKVNRHSRIRTLLKDWKRVVVIEVTDTGETFAFIFSDGEIKDLKCEAVEGEQILLRSKEATCRDVFSGALNPATAFLNGQLEVFASDRDQVKLDAIALILWGI